MSRAAACVLLLVLASAPARAASFLDNFEQGRAAVQAGRHAEGRDLLLRALAERPKEGRFKAGVVFHDYTPSRWLAEAYLGLGDAAKAEQALRAAEAVRPLSGAEQGALADLRRRIQQAAPEAPAAPAEPARPAADPGAATIAAARKALDGGDLATARRLADSSLEADPGNAAAKEIIDAVGAGLAARVARARAELAAGSLAAAQRELDAVLAVDPASASAKVLRGEVDAARRTAAKALADAEAAQRDRRGDDARRLAAKARSLDDSLGSRAREIERSAAAAGPGPAAGATAPEEAPVAVAALPADPPPAATGPPKALDAALRAYFAGDVPGCIRRLSASADDPAAGAQALAVLAAAHATLALLADEEAGRADADKARALFAQALNRQADLKLDPRYFSPRIVEVLDSVRSSRPAGATAAP